MNNMNNMNMNNMNMNNMNMNNMNNMDMQQDMKFMQMHNDRGYAQKPNQMNNMQMYNMNNTQNSYNDLANKVSHMRNQVANSIGMDPQTLLYMSPEEIENQIKKQANKGDISMNYDRKPSKKNYRQEESENSEEEDEEMDKKTKLLQMLIQMKKNNMNKEKGLKKAVDDVKKKSNKKEKKQESSETETEESEDDKNLKSSGKQKNKSKKNVKFSNNIKKYSDSDESSNESSNESEKSTKSTKSTKNNKTNKSKSKIETMTIDITPDDDLEKKYYSDFMIDFKEKYNTTYKNARNFKLKLKTLCELQPKIDENSNNLVIVINNETKRIELEEGYYTLDELVEGITANLEDVNIVCKKDKKGRVIFENTENEDFEIDCLDKSFAKYLGFCEDNYNGDSKYVSENISSLLINKIYLYIPNISDEVFCTIDKNKKIDLNYENDEPINELDCLIIQIKDIETNEENYFHNFNDKYHLTLTFDYDS